MQGTHDLFTRDRVKDRCHWYSTVK